jgi:hypothetical protein
VVADTVISSKATDTGDSGKSEVADRLGQIENYTEMKFKEAALTF